MKAPLAPLIAIASLLGAASALSQTLNWSSLTQSAIADSEGELLDNSFVFQLGAFTAEFVPDESNLEEWVNHWQVFDSADYSYNPGDQTGYFTGTQNLQDVPAYPTMFEGLKAYIWVRNAANTEYFLASASTWTFPDQDPGCCPTGVTTWSMSDLGSDTPIWGGQDIYQGGGDFNAPGPYDLQTHAVPEPGPSVLALVACGTFLLIRRRQGN
jgi:hypothetical protein